MNHQDSPAQKQARISLRNFKISEFSSEETLCFSATVIFDGRPVAEASNNGRGGTTRIRAVPGALTMLEEASKFAMGLPEDEDEYESDGKVHKYKIAVSLEYLVDCIADRIADERRIRRIFNREMRKVLFVANHKFMSLKGKALPAAAADRTALFTRLRSTYGQSLVILAELPRDDAFSLWKKYRVQD